MADRMCVTSVIPASVPRRKRLVALSGGRKPARVGVIDESPAGTCEAATGALAAQGTRLQARSRHRPGRASPQPARDPEAPLGAWSLGVDRDQAPGGAAPRE